MTKAELAAKGALKVLNALLVKYPTLDIAMSFDGDTSGTEEVKWHFDVRMFFVDGEPVFPSCNCQDDEPEGHEDIQ